MTDLNVRRAIDWGRTATCLGPLHDRCTYCREHVVRYPGGHWIGAESDTRQCTGARPGVLHDVAVRR